MGGETDAIQARDDYGGSTVKHLPKMKTVEISETQHAWCGLWLEAYEQYHAVHEMDLEDEALPESVDSPITPLRREPYSLDEVTVGQIRMLSPSLTPEASEPVFVAVIGQQGGEFLVTPYSRFPVPAFLSELCMECDEDELATLCIWNTHSLKAESLEKSWVVDALAADECRAALSVFESYLFGDPVPEALKNRIGAPILYSDDPRIPYQDEEIHRCQGLGRLQALADEAEAKEEAIWLDNLVREAEKIIMFPQLQDELLAAASEGEIKHHVLVYQSASDASPGKTSATCDMPFVIQPGQEEAPMAQWVLDGEDQQLAGARALWMLRESRLVFGLGFVDESGHVLDMEEIRNEKLQKPITHEDDILICIFLENSPR